MITAGSDDISVRMQRAQEYLNSTLRFTSKNTLDDLKEYLKRLGVPADGMKIVHVAGTNGKGSVCSQIASCLREAGFRVGLFISPHLSDIRERMTIDGEMISEEKFLACFETVRKEAEAAAGDGLPHPLYFDYLFLMAMIWFSEEKPDYLILETGLGGRLDATNSIDCKVMTVITRIGLDHTKYLGDTVGKIAAQKAGILRKDCPAVFLDDPREAFLSIKETAERVGAPVIAVTGSMWEVLRSDENGIDFLLHTRYDKNLRVHIPGRALYQCENAALAATAARILLGREGCTDCNVIRRGIENNRWPGRMEEILPDVWIDGAHNPDGMRAFLESIRNASERGVKGEQPVRRILLFSCMKDKDYRQELRMIGRSGLFAEIAAVPMSGSRALGAEDLRHLIGECADGVTVRSCASVDDAVRDYVLAKESGTEVYAAGSIYLIGEIRDLVEKRRREINENGITEGI